MNLIRGTFSAQETVLSKILWVLVRLLPGAAISFLIYYITLPPINIFSTGFWVFLFFTLLVYLLPFGLTKLFSFDVKRQNGKKVGYTLRRGTGGKPAFICLAVVAVPLVVLMLGSVFSSTFFHARSYAGIIEVTEADFATDMPETEGITNIALMDTPSATIIGNRALGDLADVVSQFELSENYTQINYHGTPQKVGNLEYAGFFKWIGNHKNGVPGYVMVDPVNNTATYNKLETPMKYTDSAYFGEDLTRKLRFDYPTKIFGTVSFELDEAGTPYFIVACMKPQVGLFGAMDVSEVILFNPADGSSTICPVTDVPRWVDIVYNGYLAEDKYDWYGTLSGGFWNSVIGNKGCKKATDDFGYLMYDDDVWYYTGVTSVNQDASNIGFILSNARTGTYKYYSVVGAEEYSAMGAAEGEVQEKGYKAAFPALVNISGEPTYLMVLKDDNNLVKLYALVNVKKYSVVVTAPTQAEAIETYREQLYQEGILQRPETPAVEHETATVTLTEVRDVTVNGNTRIYFYGDDGRVYRLDTVTDAALLLRTGMTVTFTYTETDTAGVRAVSAFAVAP
ncbi:MAG: hypothetical protein ACI3XE_05380 [Eubacteriales bacterium]